MGTSFDPNNGDFDLSRSKIDDEDDFLDILKAVSPKDKEKLTTSSTAFKKFKSLLISENKKTWKRRERLYQLAGGVLIGAFAIYLVAKVIQNNKKRENGELEDSSDDDDSETIQPILTNGPRVIVIKDEWKPEFMFIEDDGSLLKDVWSLAGPNSAVSPLRGFGSAESEAAVIRGLSDNSNKPRQRNYVWKIKSMKVQKQNEDQIIATGKPATSAQSTPVITSMTITNIFGHSFILEKTGTPNVWYVRYPGLVKGKKIYVVSNTTDRKLGKGTNPHIADRWRIVDY